MSAGTIRELCLVTLVWLWYKVYKLGVLGVVTFGFWTLPRAARVCDVRMTFSSVGHFG